MEIAGLVIGVAGLAGLFSACTEGFRLIRTGRARGKEYAILETKYGNQELRLKMWGRAVGFFNGKKVNPVLEDPEVHQQVWKTLSCIKVLLQDAGELKTKYGLELVVSGDPGNDQDTALMVVQQDVFGINGEAALVGKKNRLLTRLLSRRSRHNQDKSKDISMTSKAAWAIEDRDKFAGLVQHLKDFIDDLEVMTKDTDVSQKQRVLVELEIEEIDDIEELQNIEEAREGDDDVVSDAASARLERLSNNTASVTNATTFFTAQTHITSIASVLAGGLGTRPAPTTKPTETIKRLHCIIVGEPSAPRAQLLESYATNKPTLEGPELELFEPAYELTVMVDSKVLSLILWDITCQEDWELNLEKEAFKRAGAVLVCVSLESKEEYQLAQTKWAPQLDLHCPQAKRFLVGVGSSGKLLQDSSAVFSELETVADSIGAIQAFMCDYITQRGLKHVFDEVVRETTRDSGPSSPRLINALTGTFARLFS